MSNGNIHAASLLKRSMRLKGLDHRRFSLFRGYPSSLWETPQIVEKARQGTKRRARRASWQTQTTTDIPPSIAQTGCYKFARTNAAAPFQRFCHRYRYLREELFTVGATASANCAFGKMRYLRAARGILRRTKVSWVSRVHRTSCVEICRSILLSLPQFFFFNSNVEFLNS